MDTPLLGRDGEIGKIVALVDAARHGDGGVLAFAGEAGIGKTMLLDHAASRYTFDAQVLRATGHEREIRVPWAGLEELVRPLLDDGLDQTLPGARRDALHAALALDDGRREIESLAVYAAVRDLVVLAAERRTIVVLIDDLQWLDEPTAGAIRHAGRAWEHCAIAVVTARRLRPDDEPRTDEHVVGPMADDEALELVSAAGVTSTSMRSRLVAELGGRPMLLLAAARLLDEHERGGAVASAGPLRVPESAMVVAQRRVDRVDHAARWAMLVAATAPGGDVDVVTKVLAADERSLDDLDDAERERLVTVTSTAVVFEHPTVRSVAYHGSPGSERRRAHRLVGDHVTDPATRIQHFGLSAGGPDATLADQVAVAADRLRRRGSPVDAARALQLSARLSPDPVVGSTRLRQAAELLADTTEVAAVGLLLDRADLVDCPPAERVRRAAVRLRLRARSGEGDDVADELVRLADQVGDADPDLAASLLFDSMPPLLRSLRARDLLAVAQRVVAIVGATDDPVVQVRADVALGVAMVATGDPAGRSRLDRHAELLELAGPTDVGAFLAEVVAPVLGFLHRTADAARLLDTLERELRERDALPVLVSVLSARALLLHGPDLAGTLRAATEAVQLADLVGQPDLGRFAGSSAVVATGMMGRADECREWAERLERRPDDFSRRAALIGQGALALGHGSLDDALGFYERLRDEHGVGAGVTRWEPEWAETLVRSQRRDEAADVLELVDTAGYARWATAGLERVRGMLATEEVEAAAHFERSLAALAVAANDVGAGRTHMAWGEWLRRARRRAAAREHLQLAHQLLTRSGAASWAQRAAKELELASGVVPGRAQSVDQLTPQEMQIARLAAAGASNRDIGNELYVSPRTVETHLSAVYRKLGVRNRRELSARARVEPLLHREA